MDFSDFSYILQNLDRTGLKGSDIAPGNLFLLQNRYKIRLEIKDNFLIREYNYSESIKGFAFPASFVKRASLSLEDFFQIISENQQKKEISLCLFTEKQKNQFDDFMSEKFPEYKIEWHKNLADSDYLYLQSDLEKLPGKKLQKKKNHISKFNRTFENTSFVFFDKSNYTQKLHNDFLLVADNWIKEQTAGKEEINIYEAEKKSIEAALNNLDLFDFSCGILYVDDNPVAVTLASKISDEVLDIHFEKCLGYAAAVGGYAVINHSFIKYCGAYQYINREEDLGIEGLRKAKLSYKPEIILEKFYGKLMKTY